MNNLFSIIYKEIMSERRKILNPETGRPVYADGVTGRYILTCASKKCLRNPSTGKCVQKKDLNKPCKKLVTKARYRKLKKSCEQRILAKDLKIGKLKSKLTAADKRSVDRAIEILSSPKIDAPKAVRQLVQPSVVNVIKTVASPALVQTYRQSMDQLTRQADVMRYAKEHTLPSEAQKLYDSMKSKLSGPEKDELVNQLYEKFFKKKSVSPSPPPQAKELSPSEFTGQKRYQDALDRLAEKYAKEQSEEDEFIFARNLTYDELMHNISLAKRLGNPKKRSDHLPPYTFTVKENAALRMIKAHNTTAKQRKQLARDLWNLLQQKIYTKM